MSQLSKPLRGLAGRVRNLRRSPSPDLLMTVARLVWPEAPGPLVTSDPRRRDSALDYVALPSIRSPRWLLPADAPATAAALATQETGGAKRAAAGLLAAAHRSGLSSRLPVPRLRIAAAAGDSLPAVIAGHFAPEAAVAIRLGRWTTARSLVVRVFGPDGDTLGFGKVGLDDHGRSAVRAESAALSRLRELGVRQVRHPELLQRGSWRGLEFLLVSPLMPSGRPVADAGLPLAAMAELAHAGRSRVAPMPASDWAVTVRRRLEQVTDPALRAELADAFCRLERTTTGRPVPLGCWHGDWTPWNMTRDRTGLLLWDWEHYAEDVPIGFDPVHYLAQELRSGSGTDRAAEAAWRERSVAILAESFGLTGPQRDALLVAYLLEVNLRFVLDRRATPDAQRRREGWGLPLLQRESRRLSSD